MPKSNLLWLDDERRMQIAVNHCVHLIKLLQAGRTSPNLTTLFLLVMNVAYVKNNPAPAPKKKRKKTLIKSRGKAMFRHEIPNVETITPQHFFLISDV